MHLVRQKLLSACLIQVSETISGGRFGQRKAPRKSKGSTFQPFNRCEVLKAAEGEQRQWMDETIDYIRERYPDLSEVDLSGLHEIGTRFCQPAISPKGESTFNTLDDASVA